MFKKILFIICVIGCVACHKTGSKPACAAQVCTLEFRSVNVKFVDKEGQPVVVQNYESVNLRTGKAVKGAGVIDAVKKPGFYTVINDSSVGELSAAGDDIQVMATRQGTQEMVSATFKVSGGECACHIQKMSGPEQLVFPE